ncbi:ABC transporter permease subunit [Microbispora sp. H13382]|uniref:ABC transporter permease subunit n=1 Tax=Microbispora sp. H13382 TaxID=2729112 RepID=UPI0016003699|nr:ABC transporter permease subunit [Microbispora sp. H13382]
MSTANVTAFRRTAGPAVDRRRVTQGRVMRSEWIKLWSLRSTVYTLVAAVGTMIGAGMLLCAFMAAQAALPGSPHQALFDPAGAGLRGVSLAQLAVGVLGVLLVTAEYSTGMIRATLSAVPRRLPVLWAKAGVFTVVAAVLMIAASFTAFLGGQAVLGERGTTLAADGVARAVAGAGLYLTVVGLLGVGLGFILRNTAGAVAALFGLLLVLPTLGEVLPADWGRRVVPYLPSNAGQVIMSVRPAPGELAPWTGFAIFCGYAAVTIVVAAVLLKRRDA